MKNRAFKKLILPGLILSVFGLISAGCSTTDVKSDANVGPRLTDVEYRTQIEKNTRAEQTYQGFYNTLDVRVVFINSDVQTAILQKTADALQWDMTTAQAEREKMFQENSNSTKFFMSLYVPTRRLNNLEKPNTIWKVYLEYNGEKFEGRVKKKKEPFEALQATFPAHTRWAFPYEVTFDTPLGAVEGQELKFTITSSVAQATLTFPARL